MVVGLDKRNPTPLHYQLRQILLEGIEKGAWKPGETIPTENDLMAKYEISRSTVRQAVLSLVTDGYLRREKSKGTVVTNPSGRKRFVGGLISFTEEMDRKGIPHFSRILAQEIVKVDVLLAEKLALKSGEPVYYLKRVRYVNEQPFLVDEHYIPYAMCIGIETRYRENTSLYQLLRNEYLFNLHHGQIEFEPIISPSREITRLLNIDARTPLLQAERIVYSDRDVPLDYFKTVTRGKFSVDVVSAPEFARA